jgi:hypothetical protein
MAYKELTPKDWEKLELYMKSGATVTRIANSLGIDKATLAHIVKERYGEDFERIYCQFKSTGELLIEASQFQRALAGNIQMLLWLGKVRLGQREPDHVSYIPPAQEAIDRDHLIMELKHKLELKEKLLESYGHKPKAG